MKTKLLLLSLLAAAATQAQTTHMVNWFMGVPNSATTLTINQGDTVKWTWTDNMPHTVTSTGGTETFTSGTLSGSGQSFSHTFNSVGATSYDCDFHPSMDGTITVQAIMGLNDDVEAGFSYFPNPATDVLTITSGSNIDRVEVYDLNGRLLMESIDANPTVKVYLSNFTAGTYLVKAMAGSTVKSFPVIKQ